MKTKCIMIIMLITFLSEIGIAQNSKHQISSGIVVFDISYPDSQLDENMMASLPTESTMYFKNDKSKVEVTMPMGKTTILSDNKTGESTMLIRSGNYSGGMMSK